MNIQIAATMDGTLVGVGATPVHGARHDAHAYSASGLAETLTNIHTLADLGYIGVDGIDITPIRKPANGELHQTQADFNTQLSKIRTTVEHAIAHLKTWRMLSEEGGRYRPPIIKYTSMLKAVTGLFFFSTYSMNKPQEWRSGSTRAAATRSHQPRSVNRTPICASYASRTRSPASSPSTSATFSRQKDTSDAG
ncbi:hypothetical protein GCM10023317_85040 [Actinopolymorpha pittospori]